MDAGAERRGPLMRKAFRPRGSGHTCKCCHGEKMGLERRWKSKEEAARRQFEQQRREWEQHPYGAATDRTGVGDG